MSLFTIAVTKKNRQDYSKTILLNSKRVLSSYADSTDGGTIFHYLERSGSKVKKVEYKTALFGASFTRKMEEGNKLETIRIHVTTKKTKSRGTHDFNKYMRVPTDSIVGGIDINTASCYIDVDGYNDFFTFTTTHTIAEINGSASASTSLSRS